MLTAIVVLLVMIFIENTFLMFMVAALVNRDEETEPKSYEQAQADLFKAWGDDVIKNGVNS